MENKNKRLISYSLIGSLLLVFGFYSSTMLYVFAIEVTTYTLGTNYSVYGGAYKVSTDSWFFASSNNNTIIELDDNSTSFTTGSYNTGAGTCTDAHDILVLTSQANANYLALLCNNGSPATLELQIRESVSPYTLVDFESGFANTEDLYSMAEYVAGDRLYIVNAGTGSPLVYQFNLNNINSTLSPMFIGSIAAFSANTCWDIAISETRAQAYVSCIDGGSDPGFSIIDLGSSSSSQFIEMQADTSGGITIDVFDSNSTVVLTDVATDDVWVYSLEEVAVTSHMVDVCVDPLSPQFNRNLGQVYIVCKGNNTIAVYDPDTDTVLSNINVQTFSVTAPFGANNYPKFVWKDSQGAGYLAYAFLDPSHGATFNFVTRIQDTQGAQAPVSEFCQLPENFFILRCVLERGDTTPLQGASETIDESATNIICQIGLVQCTQNPDGSFTPVDDNIQTNGIGYIILVVALGILIGIFWVASRGDLGSIPTFLWFIATLAVIGTITAFDFIDPTILIIAIIAIIALAVAKAKGLFGSSGLFAGET